MVHQIVFVTQLGTIIFLLRSGRNGFGSSVSEKCMSLRLNLYLSLGSVLAYTSYLQDALS